MTALQHFAVQPMRRAVACHTASCAWPGPTIACAIGGAGRDELESSVAYAPPAGFAAADDGFVASQLGDGGEDGAPVAVEQRDDAPPRGTVARGSECRSVVRASWPKAYRQAAVGVASPRAARLHAPTPRAVSARRLRWASSRRCGGTSRTLRRGRGEAPSGRRAAAGSLAPRQRLEIVSSSVRLMDFCSSS